jgi:pyridoxine 5'-phosphate synthase PdxJ
MLCVLLRRPTRHQDNADIQAIVKMLECDVDLEARPSDGEMCTHIGSVLSCETATEVSVSSQPMLT